MRSESSPTVDDTYDAVTIFFHWVTALLVLAMFVLVLVPGVIKGSVALHKSVGILILVITPLRIAWRLFFGRKLQTTAAEPFIVRLGATGGHIAIYALLIITPMLGWLYQDAKAIDVDLFGTDIDMPVLVYYDHALAMTIFMWKKVAAFSLLALIGGHAGAALVYHTMIRKDGVLRAMLPRRLRDRLVIVAVALFALLPHTGMAQTKFDIQKYAADLAASLAKECPMASPSDMAAQEACRKAIGQGAEATMRGYSFLFGGEQPDQIPLKEKKTSVFRGDLFEDLYMSLFMYTGKYAIKDEPDGLQAIAVQAYFRNGLPPGIYPYPFWHSNAKWGAYEKTNELRFRVTRQGKVVFAYRADTGSEENRGPYAHVDRPPFLGEWMWRDDSGAAQPVVTLFSQYYSKDNPNLGALDEAYRKMALSFRQADCIGCHTPEGHWKMNKLTLLQTPLHAATSIDAVLDEVRGGRMPFDDYDDPRPLDPDLRKQLLANGEAFRDLIHKADDWERSNNRPKAHIATQQ